MKRRLNPPRGHDEYRVVPFCLANATAVFQALVNYVLGDLLEYLLFCLCVCVYPDDILVVRCVEASVSSVLQRPGEASPKAEKS